MDIIFWLLFALYIVASAVLVFVVLIQSGKGGGLSSLVGAGTTLGDTLGASGVEKTLNRWTTYCAIGFLIICILMVIMGPHIYQKSFLDKLAPSGATQPAGSESAPPAAGSAGPGEGPSAPAAVPSEGTAAPAAEAPAAAPATEVPAGAPKAEVPAPAPLAAPAAPAAPAPAAPVAAPAAPAAPVAAPAAPAAPAVPAAPAPAPAGK